MGARSVPRGKYCLNRRLVFSLVQRCHGLCGSQKYTFTSVATVNSLCLAISCPRSQVSERRRLAGSLRRHAGVARRGVQCLQPQPVLWPCRCEWKYLQHNIRTVSKFGPTPAAATGPALPILIGIVHGFVPSIRFGSLRPKPIQTRWLSGSANLEVEEAVDEA